MIVYSQYSEAYGVLLTHKHDRRPYAVSGLHIVRALSVQQSLPKGKTVGVGRACEGALAAGVMPASGQSTQAFSTAPTAWDSDGALTFDSIVGNAPAKRALFEHVVLPLKLSEEARNSLFGTMCAWQPEECRRSITLYSQLTTAMRVGVYYCDDISLRYRIREILHSKHGAIVRRNTGEGTRPTCAPA